MVIVFRRVTSARNNPRLFLLSVRSSSVSVIYFQARRMDRDFVEEHEPGSLCYPLSRFFEAGQ